ncbi:hypothetical protein GCM10020218_064970 [Dactylosporangium vinaceum]
MIRIVVEKVFDWPGRGLMVSGFPLGGIIEPGMRLGNGAGARATVLAVEAQSPRDRREGWVTVVLEHTTPTPAAEGVMLTVEQSPPVPYTYHVTPDPEAPEQVTIAEATPGTMRAAVISLRTSRRSWAAGPPPGSQEITREQAQQILESARTMIPSDPELRRILLRRL